MANSSGVAPICNAPPQQPKFGTTPPPMPRFSPPSADNLQSIVQAILQIQTALQTFLNPPPPNNTVNGFPTGSGGPGPGNNAGGGGGNKKPTQAKWEESERHTENVKVVNPDDDSQFVIVKEITSVTFERRLTTGESTGESLTITRDPS